MAGNPKGTWQIDPFGHSNTQSWLLSAEAGMGSLFWGRMDYQDFNKRKPEKGAYPKLCLTTPSSPS